MRVGLSCALLAFCLLICLAAAPADRENGSLVQGSIVTQGETTLTVVRLDTLPLVDSDYSRRFVFDAANNPKLEELRRRFRLDEVVQPGTDEFDQQVRLMDWTHRQFKKFGPPSAWPQGALEILQGIEAGQTFYCSHYAKVLVSAAASLGWVNRPLALRRHQGVARGGSTEHSTTEIWSNQHRKWIMLDPTANMYLERNGVPLNAVEIRRHWFYEQGRDLVFVVGKERQRYRRADLPVFLARFAGFGDLTIEPDELDKYGFIGYIPNTNLMDAREDYARMFIVKDQLCDGTRWHVRLNPPNPEIDPYFPINQAALQLRAQGLSIDVTLQTLTPNFRRYECRIDGGDWRPSSASFAWPLHSGRNQLEARAVNQFEVPGPSSTAEVQRDH